MPAQSKAIHTISLYPITYRWYVLDVVVDGVPIYSRGRGQGGHWTGWTGIIVFALFVLVTADSRGAGLLPGPVSHPDGVIGKPGIVVEAAYTSISGDEGFAFNDISGGRLQLTTPVAPALTLGAVGEGFSQADSTYYSVHGLMNIHFGNPLALASPQACNPDGRIGIISLQVKGGADISDVAAGDRRWFVDGTLLWPLSPGFTVGGGYVWRDSDRPGDAIEGYGTIRWYSSSYRLNEAYKNPDGAPGSMVVHLTGGASANGAAGRLDLMVPLHRSATIGIGTGAEIFDERGETRLTARLRLAWYPR